MTTNINVTGFPILGNDSQPITINSTLEWIQQCLQILNGHSTLEANVLTQGFEPRILQALAAFIEGLERPALVQVVPAHLNQEARHSIAAGRAFRAWQLQWLSDLRISLGTNAELEFLAAITTVPWVDIAP